MENVAESGNSPWLAMNLTICQIQPANGMFQQELIQDKGTKDKNQFPKSNSVYHCPDNKDKTSLKTVLFMHESLYFQAGFRREYDVTNNSK